MKNLTEGNIYKTFILFAIPLVLSGILSQGYSLVDINIVKMIKHHTLSVWCYCCITKNRRKLSVCDDVEEPNGLDVI